MKFFSELINRLKWGYPIGGGYRAYAKTRDNYVIWKDGREFELFVVFLVDNAVVMSKSSKPDSYLNPVGERLEDRDWEEGFDLLAGNFQRQGKRVIFQ